MNVLIVEDVFLARQTLKQILEGHGAKVDEAEKGKQAIRFVKNNEYNYILIDLGLPDVNGIDLIKDIKQLGTKAKIIVASGQSEREILFKCISAGADQYLVKPLDFERLIEMIFTNKKIMNNSLSFY